jgi:serine/threonine protein kinase/tetratricopeptide (TPR) repeat protein
VERVIDDPAADPTGPGETPLSGEPTRPYPPREDSGETIGPYRLLERVGEGGMGEVWLAEQERPVRRRLAIKLIKAGMDTKQVVARFEAERQALALMDHPTIAKVFDAGQTPRGLPFFAMEYVQGEPITRYCDRHRLPMRERLALFLEVCDGVQHAHHKGIIHRDLKPANILVAVHGGRPQAKIIDFGVAKATGLRLTERTMFTELGMLVGTPEYMSPEQAERTGLDVDTRTDVYSLGVLLYELLTGALPFDSRELREAGFEEIRRRIREVDPPRPSTRVRTLGERSVEAARCRRTEPGRLASQLRGELDWIVMKALEKDRIRRYDSPGGLRGDLERFLRNEPVLAGPPSALYRARKFARRHRFGVAVAAAAILGLLAFAATAVAQAQRTARERDRAERVSDFLVRLFEGSDPKQARGKDTRVREILDEGAQRIEQELSEEPLVRAQLMDTMGRVYSQLGLYDKAAELLEQATVTRTRELGPEARETLFAKTMLGYVWYRQGRFEDAERIVLEAREALTRRLGPEDRETLGCTSTLTLIRMGLGRYAEAIREQGAALEVWRRTVGREDPDTLVAAANLAIVHQLAGNLAEAEKLHAEILEVRRRVLGEDHPETPRTMQQLANIRLAQGRARESEELNRRALEIRRRVLGPEHTETAFSLTSLALDLQAQGRYAEAEALHEEAVAVQRKALGAEHPDTLWAMYHRAGVAALQGRIEEAERLHREVLEIRRRSLGPDHPDARRSFRALAELEPKRAAAGGR